MRQGHKWENEVFFFLNYLFKGLVNLKYYNEKNSITYLELGYDIGIVIAVLEGDLVLIVKALKEGGQSLTSFNPLIEDANLFSKFFTQLLYSYTSREGNNLTHNLARYLINVLECIVQIEDIPPQVYYILYTYITGFS